MVFEEAGGEPKMQRAPKPLLWALGLFNPSLRETLEMLYEFEEPFVVDHSAFARAFGDTARPLSDSRTARRFMERGGLSMSENPGLPAKQAYENARRHVPVPRQ